MPSRSNDRRCYVAGGTADVKRVNAVQEIARTAGYTITFDWTGAEGEIRTDGSWDMVPERGAEIATREIEACATADLTIVLCPPLGKGLGCWIEMGATLAGGGEVWCIAPARDSVFWQHPRVRRFPDVAAVAVEFHQQGAFDVAA